VTSGFPAFSGPFIQRAALRLTQFPLLLIIQASVKAFAVLYFY
jgi:hypothetical protein